MTLNQYLNDDGPESPEEGASTDATLTDDRSIEERWPLTFEKVDSIFIPAQGSVVGSIYHCEEYDEDVYVSLKENNKHFFRKGNGYAISVEAIDRLQEQDIEYMFFIEKDEGDVYRFTVSQYADGEYFDESWTPDPQRCVDISDCDRVWVNGYDDIVL